MEAALQSQRFNNNHGPQNQRKHISNQVVTCGELIVGCFQDGDLERAKHHLNESIASLQGISHKAFCHSLIHYCGRSGNSAALEWCALQMFDMGIQANIVTFNTLLDACANAGDVDRATHVWDMLSKDLTPNKITFNTMLKVCLRNGNPRLAEEWISRMMNAGIPCSVVSYQTMIRAYIKADMPDMAEVWFMRMRRAGVKAEPAIWQTIIQAFAKTNLEKAERYFLDMELNDVPGDSKLCMTMIHACVRSRDLAGLDRWLKLVLDREMNLDENTMRLVTNAYASGGKLGQAMWWTDAMLWCGFPAPTECHDEYSKWLHLPYFAPQGSVQLHPPHFDEGCGVSSEQETVSAEVPTSPPIPSRLHPPIPTRLISKSRSYGSM